MDISNALPLFVLAVIAVAMPTFVSTRFWLNIFIIVFVKCTISVSLRTLALSGNMSFAHGAFMGIGAYTAATLANHAGLPPYLTIPAAAVLAMVIGVVTGFPFIRLRSVYFVMASLFLGISIVYVFSSMKILGGLMGISYVPPLFSNIMANYYFFLVLAVVCCSIMYRFEFSRIGVTLRAIAQSPEAAAAMGVSETYFKLLAVGVGCFFAGLAGAAYAHYNSMLSPNSFGFLASLWFMIYIMIGGQDKFVGPILGSIILVVLPEASRAMNQYAPYVTAAVMILAAYLLPGGLASIPSVAIKTICKVQRRRVTPKAKVGGSE